MSVRLIRARLIVLGLIGCLARPAHAIESCYLESVGSWQGPVYNGTGPKPTATEFHQQPDGTLAGSYQIDDVPPVSGTLGDFTPVGPCTAQFKWTDRYGSGTVTIHFEPQLDRFKGLWGFGSMAGNKQFDGFRKGSISWLGQPQNNRTG